jgi:DNA polymerase-3 subunit epsilon
MTNAVKYALAFDVETTGLLYKPVLKTKNNKTVESVEDTDIRRQMYLSESPYITQLCYILYDIESQTIVETFCSYVKIPDNVAITDEITKLTGFTRENSDSGMSITDVLTKFYENYKRSDIIVAHNIGFDKEMVNIELSRNQHILNPEIAIFRLDNNAIYSTDKKNMYCTMYHGKFICNIKIKYTAANGTEKTITKNPKLCELHETLFGYIPNNLHDAFNDTFACLRCFTSMKYNITIGDI